MAIRQPSQFRRSRGNAAALSSTALRLAQQKQAEEDRIALFNYNNGLWDEQEFVEYSEKRAKSLPENSLDRATWTDRAADAREASNDRQVAQAYSRREISAEQVLQYEREKLNSYKSGSPKYEQQQSAVAQWEKRTRNEKENIEEMRLRAKIDVGEADLSELYNFKLEKFQSAANVESEAELLARTREINDIAFNLRNEAIREQSEIIREIRDAEVAERQAQLEELSESREAVSAARESQREAREQKKDVAEMIKDAWGVRKQQIEDVATESPFQALMLARTSAEQLSQTMDQYLPGEQDQAALLGSTVQGIGTSIDGQRAKATKWVNDWVVKTGRFPTRDEMSVYQGITPDTLDELLGKEQIIAKEKEGQIATAADILGIQLAQKSLNAGDALKAKQIQQGMQQGRVFRRTESGLEPTDFFADQLRVDKNGIVTLTDNNTKKKYLVEQSPVAFDLADGTQDEASMMIVHEIEELPGNDPEKAKYLVTVPGGEQVSITEKELSGKTLADAVRVKVPEFSTLTSAGIQPTQATQTAAVVGGTSEAFQSAPTVPAVIMAGGITFGRTPQYAAIATSARTSVQQGVAAMRGIVAGLPFGPKVLDTLNLVTKPIGGVANQFVSNATGLARVAGRVAAPIVAAADVIATVRKAGRGDFSTTDVIRNVADATAAGATFAGPLGAAAGAAVGATGSAVAAGTQLFRDIQETGFSLTGSEGGLAGFIEQARRGFLPEATPTQDALVQRQQRVEQARITAEQFEKRAIAAEAQRNAALAEQYRREAEAKRVEAQQLLNSLNEAKTRIQESEARAATVAQLPASQAPQTAAVPGIQAPPQIFSQPGAGQGIQVVPTPPTPQITSVGPAQNVPKIASVGPAQDNRQISVAPPPPTPQINVIGPKPAPAPKKQPSVLQKIGGFFKNLFR